MGLRRLYWQIHFAVCPAVCVLAWLPACLSVQLCPFVFACLAFLFPCLSSCLCACLAFFVSLSVQLCVWLLGCLSVCVTVFVSVSLITDLLLCFSGSFCFLCFFCLPVSCQQLSFLAATVLSYSSFVVATVLCCGSFVAAIVLCCSCHTSV